MSEFTNWFWRGIGDIVAGIAGGIAVCIIGLIAFGIMVALAFGPVMLASSLTQSAVVELIALCVGVVSLIGGYLAMISLDSP